jgi:hypothetical protein
VIHSGGSLVIGLGGSLVIGFGRSLVIGLGGSLVVALLKVPPRGRLPRFVLAFVAVACFVVFSEEDKAV